MLHNIPTPVIWLLGAAAFITFIKLLPPLIKGLAWVYWIIYVELLVLGCQFLEIFSDGRIFLSYISENPTLEKMMKRRRLNYEYRSGRDGATYTVWRS